MKLTEIGINSLFTRLRENSLSTGISTEDAINIEIAIEKTSAVEGDIAEVGVSGGGSAIIIAEVKGEKCLHLFDTFEGLPELGEEDKESAFKKGQYITSFALVQSYFNNLYPNVFVYKGLFPQDTGKEIADKKFSFVHLDVDLYQSTCDALAFFWPRINEGGILICHDYQTEKGVRKALDGFGIEVKTIGKSQGIITK